MNIIIPGRNLDGLDKELLKQANDYFDEAKTYTKVRRDKWKELYRAWTNSRLSEKRPKYKSSTRVNYCWIITQIKTPIILASNPTVNFVSYDKTPEAEEAARKLSKIVGNYLYHKLGLRKKLSEVVLNSQIFDVGYWKIGFNPHDGKYGEVFVSVVDPFRLFPDPFATEFYNARYIVDVGIFPVETLRKRYPHAAKAITADPSISDLVYENRRFEDRRPEVIITGSEVEYKTERAFLKEYWIAPEVCPDVKGEDGKPLYKNGMIVKIINDSIVVEKTPYPYKHGKPPYVKFVSNLVPNDFYGMGDIEQILPLQDTLNHRIQQLEDIANRCANPGYTVDPQVGKKAIKNLQKNGLKPGLIKVMPPGMLVPDPIPQVPQWLYEEIKNIIIMIERVSGITDVMQGRGDVRQRTARGIERLWEAGSSRIGMSVKLFEESYKEAAYQMGSLVRQYYKERRVINIAGDSNSAREIFEISPDELEQEFEISVDTAATLPQDKKSRADLVFFLLQNHIFDMALSQDPMQKKIARIVLDTVEFPGREELLRTNPQMQQAGQQVGQQAGQIPEVAPGVPAVSNQLAEMAQAAGISPEELQQIIQTGLNRPTAGASEQTNT